MNGFNVANFLKGLEALVTGDGYKKSYPLPLSNWHDSGGLLLTTTLSAMGHDLLDTGSKQLVIFIDDDETSMGIVPFSIPQSYDSTLDKLRIRLLVSMDGGTSNAEVLITSALYRKRAGAAATADLDPTDDTDTYIPSAVADAKWIEINADGNGLQGGDQMTLHLTSGSHATDGIIIYGAEFIINDDLAYYNDDDRSIAD